MKADERQCAPIMIPTLCRYEHFVRCVESLKRNTWAKYTDLYIGLDYPPNEKYREGYDKIKKYLETGDFSNFLSIHVIKRECNYGAKNGAELRDYILTRYDRFIKTDDDIEFSPNFLEYINKCLDAYENDPSVIAVSGYSYPIDWEVSDGSTVFKENFSVPVWGVGFWRDKYIRVRNEICQGKVFEDFDKVVLQRKYRNMLDASIVEYIPQAVFKRSQQNTLMTLMSDISLRVYVAIEDKYVISPVLSKARNYGFDGTGVYCQNLSKKEKGNFADNYDYSNQPIDENTDFQVVENSINNVSENLRRLNRFDRRSIKKKLISKILIYISFVFSPNVVAKVGSFIYPLFRRCKHLYYCTNY